MIVYISVIQEVQHNQFYSCHFEEKRQRAVIRLASISLAPGQNRGKQRSNSGWKESLGFGVHVHHRGAFAGFPFLPAVFTFSRLLKVEENLSPVVVE